MTGPTGTQSAVKSDMMPTSADHWVRLIVCGLLVAAGIYLAVTHPRVVAWERYDLIMVLGMIGGGLLIGFTRTILSAAAAFLPWVKKNGNGQPPAAEG